MLEAERSRRPRSISFVRSSLRYGCLKGLKLYADEQVRVTPRYTITSTALNCRIRCINFSLGERSDLGQRTPRRCRCFRSTVAASILVMRLALETIDTADCSRSVSPQPRRVVSATFPEARPLLLEHTPPGIFCKPALRHNVNRSHLAGGFVWRVSFL
jgi:hypothetical protein